MVRRCNLARTPRALKPTGFGILSAILLCSVSCRRQNRSCRCAVVDPMIRAVPDGSAVTWADTEMVGRLQRTIFRPGCRRRYGTRSIVRSRCAMNRPSKMDQIVSTRHCIRLGSRGGRREAYISTQHPPTCQEARVSLSHEHPRRACRTQEPPRQGPRPTLGLIGRIRERHAFVRLGREGTRIRRSALWCSWCPDPDSTATFVAFAINRAYGPAVTRNRLRRRLRAILRELDRSDPLPPGLLLIGPRPPAIELTFDQLRHELTALTRQIRRHPITEHPQVEFRA